MIFSEYISGNNPLMICPKFLSEKHFGNQAKDYLPVDTGIEIECNVPKDWNKDWLDLPGIIANKSDGQELRLRVPSGLEGFKIIWNICEHLNSNNYILTESAIHFHIDISEHEENIKVVQNDKDLINYCKNELLKWDHVNEITSGNGFNFFKKSNTIEIRCGKMTFDYKEMIKDIIWSHYIVKYVKEYANQKENIHYQNLIMQKREFELTGSTLIKNRVIHINL